VEVLCEGVDNPSIAQAMYALAAGTIEIDTDMERQWLDQLGTALGLSRAMITFLEEDL